jgi:uncharacterized protein YbjT (DUF2867 family)
MHKERQAVIFGATGLVGAALMKQLLSSERYSKVLSFVRRGTGVTHPRLIEYITDFDQPESFKKEIKGDDIFLCVGTTIAKAGTKDNFFKVDHGYNFNAAEIAKQNGIQNCLLVSAIGADAKSGIFYSMVKGKLEEDIAELGFHSLHIFRPSLLLGKRNELRIGERIAVIFSSLLLPVLRYIKSDYTPVEAEDVAKAMINMALRDTEGVCFYAYRDIMKAIKNK